MYRVRHPFKGPPVMLNGTFNPAFFRHLQHAYESKTGYNLVLSDTNGSIQMGLPNCDKFPCMRSCRECREQIVSEALRTGQVCVDACHQGYIIWGLPFAIKGKTVGGAHCHRWGAIRYPESPEVSGSL